jgi:hypothetical protein
MTAAAAAMSICRSTVITRWVQIEPVVMVLLQCARKSLGEV